MTQFSSFIEIIQRAKQHKLSLLLTLAFLVLGWASIDEIEKHLESQWEIEQQYLTQDFPSFEELPDIVMSRPGVRMGQQEKKNAPVLHLQIISDLKAIEFTHAANSAPEDLHEEVSLIPILENSIQTNAP